jgi:outer membrane translocation and assembly module TamA
VQAEYRGRLARRLGYVVFAGAGSVGSDLGDAISSSYHVAGGVGARLRLSRKFPLDYAIDVSINDQAENILYVSVGQRF